MLATLFDKPFDDDDWFFEIKWDGVRAIATVNKTGNPVISSRSGKDLLVQFPELATLRLAFSAHPVIVDGEIVAMDEDGKSSFQLLQQRLNRRAPDPRLMAKVPVRFALFDLLYAKKTDLRERPLEERKALLQGLLRAVSPHVMLSKHIIGNGSKLYAFAKSHELEGIIAKERQAPYVERRTKLWLKIKTHFEQEFVIGGWTEPRGSREKFGALLLGLYEDGVLRYAGHVGTGFDRERLQNVMNAMAPLQTDRCPFEKKPKTNSPSHWLKPKLVAQIRFGEWTTDKILRQPVFLGLRHDKKPTECVREDPVPLSVKAGKSAVK
ncbi:MAG: ATP-dependent DNA ligase [Candidatus Eremiobacter antarcticus]|nr:ATP-dependent DNA ligase [Candidatus Eremiobacteraeota bacterium]MBC5808983.1 ATP-dependent DNA ligase [Candidatus Eremiobacteraeota bacterium]PZR60340.1 MAG: ATP-dependent DNA ligase [Candidatus Eremiobacter sp. RRmetagenome_bin22]